MFHNMVAERKPALPDRILGTRSGITRQIPVMSPNSRALPAKNRVFVQPLITDGPESCGGWEEGLRGWDRSEGIET